MNCKNCSNIVQKGQLLGCNNCGTSFCYDCAKNTKMICPYCYSDLEFKG